MAFHGWQSQSKTFDHFRVWRDCHKYIQFDQQKTFEHTKERPQDRAQISEGETIFISENLELSKDTIIQNKKVVLNMVTIQTFEHDLTIIADEFVSNHSMIQNFPEGQKAGEQKTEKAVEYRKNKMSFFVK